MSGIIKVVQAGNKISHHAIINGKMSRNSIFQGIDNPFDHPELVLAAFEPTEADLQRKLTDEQLSELCLKVKCKVKMYRWNPVYDYQQYFRKKGRFDSWSPRKQRRMLARAINRNKAKYVVKDEEIQLALKKEWRYRFKDNLMRLDLWEYDRNKAQERRTEDSSDQITDNDTECEADEAYHREVNPSCNNNSGDGADDNQDAEIGANDSQYTENSMWLQRVCTASLFETLLEEEEPEEREILTEDMPQSTEEFVSNLVSADLPRTSTQRMDDEPNDLQEEAPALPNGYQGGDAALQNDPTQPYADAVIEVEVQTESQPLTQNETVSQGFFFRGECNLDV